MSIEEQFGVQTPVPIVDEAEAGRASKVKKEIGKLIKMQNSSTFDIAELLHEAKTKNYFREWGFDNFTGYVKSLEMKAVKCYYLVNIVSNMKAAALAREEYEPVGIAKLRSIARLNPEGEFNGTPMPMVIRELTLKAPQMTAEEVQVEVETIMGKVGDESMVWLNIHLKRLSRENIIKPALELAKKHIGSTSTDADGVAQDATDGRALELICANFLADPNFALEPMEQVPMSAPEVEGEWEDDGEGGIQEMSPDVILPSDEVIEKLMSDEED
jgi:hypothetical protein